MDEDLGRAATVQQREEEEEEAPEVWEGGRGVSLTPKLSVLLLEVTQLHHQLLTGDALLVDQLVPVLGDRRVPHQRQ